MATEGFILNRVLHPNQASYVTHIIQNNYSNKGCQIDGSITTGCTKDCQSHQWQKLNVTFFLYSKNIISYFKICKMTVEAKHVIIQAVK